MHEMVHLFNLSIFTFHYGRIQSLKSWTVFRLRLDLHSIMVGFNRIRFKDLNVITVIFTFHYGRIQS